MQSISCYTWRNLNINAGKTFYRSRFEINDVNIDLGKFVFYLFLILCDIMLHLHLIKNASNLLTDCKSGVTLYKKKNQREKFTKVNMPLTMNIFHTLYQCKNCDLNNKVISFNCAFWGQWRHFILSQKCFLMFFKIIYHLLRFGFILHCMRINVESVNLFIIEVTSLNSWDIQKYHKINLLLNPMIDFFLLFYVVMVSNRKTIFFSLRKNRK